MWIRVRVQIRAKEETVLIGSLERLKIRFWRKKKVFFLNFGIH